MLHLVSDFLDQSATPHALIGGFAMHAYGVPRATIDLDFVVPVGAQDGLIRHLENHGYETLHRSPAYSNHLHRDAALGRVDFPARFAISPILPTWLACLASIGLRCDDTSCNMGWRKSSRPSLDRNDLDSLEADVPTTAEDVAALRAARATTMTGDEYLAFLASLGDSPRDVLAARPILDGEPFVLQERPSGARGSRPSSIVDRVRISTSDPGLETADSAIRDLTQASLQRQPPPRAGGQGTTRAAHRTRPDVRQKRRRG